LNVFEWNSHAAGAFGFTFEPQRRLSRRLYTLFFNDLGELSEGVIEALVLDTSWLNVMLLQQIAPCVAQRLLHGKGEFNQAHHPSLNAGGRTVLAPPASLSTTTHGS
jgi:hypothetical protein